MVLMIRMALSVVLLVGVYSETGGWTTFTLALLILANELAADERYKDGK